MPTLKEIKGRIGSVKNTLKITSAMKLVSSAKLRKAQHATEAMRPYEVQLQRMLAVVAASRSTERAQIVSGTAGMGGSDTDTGVFVPGPAETAPRPTAIIAIASNSSLCGGFNANAIAKVRSVRQKGDVIYSIGRKMADVMRKEGFPSPEDFTALAERPQYGPAAQLVVRLTEDLEAGRIGKVLLVYNHYVSTARQTPVVEQLLPAAGNPSPEAPVQDDRIAPDRPPSVILSASEESVDSVAPDVILEPGAAELLSQLLPKTLKLKLYAALLDSAAAEHAARTVAMQTATDNGEKLLDELTLQYNKGRQQKITSEILDLAGGQAAE